MTPDQVKHGAELYVNMSATDLPEGVPVLMLMWIISLADAIKEQSDRIAQLEGRSR